MNTTTKTIVINKPANDVFNFVSREENLPQWAIHYVQSIEKKGSDYTIKTPIGKMLVEIISDPKTGVLDIKSGPQKDSMITCPARVVDLPGETSLFMMTCMQGPGVSDEEYEMQGKAIDEELATIAKAMA